LIVNYTITRTEPTGIDPSVAPGTHPTWTTLLRERQSPSLPGMRCLFFTPKRSVRICSWWSEAGKGRSRSGVCSLCL